MCIMLKQQNKSRSLEGPNRNANKIANENAVANGAAKGADPSVREREKCS